MALNLSMIFLEWVNTIFTLQYCCWLEYFHFPLNFSYHQVQVEKNKKPNRTGSQY